MEQVLANQRYIVEGVRHFRETTDAPLAFFDGHLLVDLRSTIVDIPLQVISDLHLAGIVVVHDSVTAIADRRLVDGSRRRDQKAPEELDAEQSRTERLSRDYSSKLSIPLEILSAGDVEGLRSFADGLLG
jgi:adenylate kinase